MALFCLIIITKITKELWKFLQLTQESPKSILGSRRCRSNRSNGVLIPPRMAECAATSGETAGGSTFNARIQSQGPLGNLPLRSLLFLD